MGADENRIVKTIRFHPTELAAINEARGDETFTGWVLTAVHQRLGTPLIPQARTPRRPTNGDAPAWNDDVIPEGADCPLCGATVTAPHRPGCLYQ